MQIIKKSFRRGDTLIEVIFAVAIFSAVSMSVLTTMNRMLSDAQSSMESVMARSTIDAQAEIIRFIHSSFVESDATVDNTLSKTWMDMVGRSVPSGDIRVAKNVTSCSDTSLTNDGKSFVIDPRTLTIIESDDIGNSPLYPRFIYSDDEYYQISENENELGTAEGIWVTAVNNVDSTGVINYYDFYIQTCWYAPGNGMPRTISTVIRLNNPSILTPTPTYTVSPDTAVVKYDVYGISGNIILPNNGNTITSYSRVSYNVEAKDVSGNVLSIGDTVDVGGDKYKFEGFKISWSKSDGSAGWYCTQSSPCATYSDYAEKGEVVEATAMFTKQSQYTVTYSSGSVTCSSVPSSEQTSLGYSPIAYTLKSAPSGCASGYNFSSWRVNGANVNPGETVYISADTTVTAQWTDLHPVEVVIRYPKNTTGDTVSFSDTRNVQTITLDSPTAWGGTFGNGSATVEVYDTHGGGRTLINTYDLGSWDRKCGLTGAGLFCDAVWTVGTVQNGVFTETDTVGSRSGWF